MQKRCLLETIISAEQQKLLIINVFWHYNSKVFVIYQLMVTVFGYFKFRNEVFGICVRNQRVVLLSK